jgi:hypothetical protein
VLFVESCLTPKITGQADTVNVEKPRIVTEGNDVEKQEHKPAPVHRCGYAILQFQGNSTSSSTATFGNLQ